jgi:ABC-type methionine transport system permease subunit
MSASLNPNQHPNYNEHKNAPVSFVVWFVVSGFIATILGGALEKLVTYLQKDGQLQTGKLYNIFFLTIQLILNSIVFLILLKYITFKNKFGKISFDDWLSGTFQGIIFTTAFFSSQTNLPLYAANIFN